MRKMTNLLLLFISFLIFLQGGLCVPHHRHFKARKTLQPLASAVASRSVNDSVIALCKKSSYPDLCVLAVQPFLPDHGHVGPKDMLIMHVKASRSGLVRATAEANKALRKKKMSPEERSCLETCKENYDDSDSSLDAALDAMAKSDGGTLNAKLSAAMTDVSTCDDAFSDFPGLTSPLTGCDEELQHLMSNALYFGTII